MTEEGWQAAFVLDPVLKKDTIFLGEMDLSALLLMNDSQYPWFILVPMQENLTEIFELSELDQQRLWQESSRLAAWLSQTFAADKINIAALGNMVPQLHMHHIARFKHDACWPKPVWGAHPAIPYTMREGTVLFEKVQQSDLLAGNSLPEPSAIFV